MGISAGIGAMTAVYGSATLRPELAATITMGELQPWERNAFTRRLRPKASHCAGCGAPLVLKDGVCEYCGLPPKE